VTRRSRASLERRMRERKEAHRIPDEEQEAIQKQVHMSLGAEGKLRYSRICGLLSPEGRAEFEAERKKAAHCRLHGELSDPACAITGEGEDRRIVFICPWCSGPAVLELWEKEGAS